MIKQTSLRSQISTVVAVAALISCLGCGHTARVDVSSDPICSYEYGQSRKALTAVEAQVREASPEEMKEIEARLLSILQAPSCTYDGKQFACRVLRRMGSKECVPVLEKLLYDEELHDMARFALQGLPCSCVDKAFRKALGKLTGDYRIGVVGSIGARRDAGAVPQLAKLAKSDDKALADACISALRQIGGAAAERALNDVL